MPENEEEAANGGEHHDNSRDEQQDGVPREGAVPAEEISRGEQNEQQSECGERPRNHGNRRPWRRNPFVWDFKFSTVSQAIFSVVQLIFAFALICVGYWQYRVYSKQEADSRAFQRSYINVPQMSVESLTRVIRGKQVKVWRFSPKFVNDGNTPTSDMHYIVGVQTFFNAAQKSAPFIEAVGIMHFRMAPVMGAAPLNRIQFPNDPGILAKTHKRRVFTLVGAHSSQQQVSWIEIPQNMLAWSIKHGWRTFFYGQATYMDVFDQSKAHITDFCFLLTGEDMGSGFRARASLCNYWNCADAECKRDKENYDEAVREEKAKHPGQPPLPTGGLGFDFK